eukprot:GHVS01009512.1.p1 GENE.GHVS01009512.1~~GHVS01009512.1.p1  ORF type:complete len:204 (+),score=1.75 GHVS01009512.1:65-676(+)
MLRSVVRGRLAQREQWRLWVQQHLHSSIVHCCIFTLVTSHGQNRFASNGSRAFESVAEFSRGKQNCSLNPNVRSSPHEKTKVSEAISSLVNRGFSSGTVRPYSLRSLKVFKEICKLTQLEADQLAEECKTRMIAKPANCLPSWKPVHVAGRSLPFPHPGAIFSGMLVVPGVSPLQLLCPNVATSIFTIADAFYGKGTQGTALK